MGPGRVIATRLRWSVDPPAWINAWCTIWPGQSADRPDRRASSGIPARPCLGTGPQHDSEHVHHCSANTVVFLCWTLAILRPVNAPFLLREIDSNEMLQTAQLTASSWASLAWSFATIRVPATGPSFGRRNHQPSWRKWRKRSWSPPIGCPFSPGCNHALVPFEVSTVLWSFATLEHGHDPLFCRLRGWLSGERWRMDLHCLITTLWAHVRLGYRDHSFLGLLADAIQRKQVRVRPMPPHPVLRAWHAGRPDAEGRGGVGLVIGNRSTERSRHRRSHRAVGGLG